MSNSHLFMKALFPRAPLSNGLGRYVCQLQRITLKFCKSHGSSRGAREFIEHDLINYASANSGVVVYVKPRRHRSPVISAEYLNGERKYMSVHCFSREEINKWMNLLRNESGCSDGRLRKMWHTENPSIQGPWSPFTNRDPELNLVEYPNKDCSKTSSEPPTATERLLEIYKELKEKEKGRIHG